MEKSLRILGLVAVLGAVAIVAAQVASIQGGTARQRAGDRGTGSVIASGPGGVRLEARRNQHPGPHPFLEPNAVLREMQHAFTTKHNMYVEQASAAGNERLVDPIIKVNCYTMLTLMRPDQQMHEMHDVWQVDVWVPNDTRWAAVCKAPSMVKELLAIDAQALAKVQAESDRVSSEAMAGYQHMVDALNGDPGFRAKSRGEQIEIIREENRKLNAGKSKLEMATEAAGRADHMLAFIRQNLATKAQVDEFDGFSRRFEEEIEAVMKGKAPSFLEN